MVAPVKNKTCHVCDEILPKKHTRSIFNEFFFYSYQLCEILGRFYYEHFDWSEITLAKVIFDR